VSPRFFSVLALLRPGRVFTVEEERFGGPLAVVISDGFWRRRFAGDPGVLTALSSLRTKVRDRRRHAARLHYPAPDVELWLPKQAAPGLMRIREARFYGSVGRLSPVSQSNKRKQISQRYSGGSASNTQTDAGWTVVLEPLKDELVGKSASLSGIGRFRQPSPSDRVANVACLLLARLNARAAEIALRRSLGAGRGAIARQLLVEGLAYAMLGGLLGLAMTLAGIDVVRKQLPDLPRIAELAVNPRMLVVVTASASWQPSCSRWRPSCRHFVAKPPVHSYGRPKHRGSRQQLPRILGPGSRPRHRATDRRRPVPRSLVRLQEAPLGFAPDTVLALRVGASFNEEPDA